MFPGMRPGNVFGIRRTLDKFQRFTKWKGYEMSHTHNGAGTGHRAPRVRVSLTIPVPVFVAIMAAGSVCAAVVGAL